MESFAGYYFHMQQEIARISQEPEKVRAMESDAARLLGISIVEFRSIGSLFGDLRLKLEALDAEGRSYVRKHLAKGATPPERSVLEAFEERRHKILLEGRTALQPRLSAKSWSSLDHFIRHRSPPPQ